MKRLLLTSLILIAFQSSAQIQYSSNNAANYDSQVQRNAGPRFGITYITNGKLTNELEKEGVTSNWISQFGYQFEKQILGDDNIAGIVEGILFVGGVDQGLFLPSISGMFGIRNSSGLEIAVGPNISVSGSAMVVGFGKSFNFGNLNIPINIAWVPGVQMKETNRVEDENGDFLENEDVFINTGHRFTITVGFNMAK
ncbi:hypothetical protein N9Y35_01080 [Flavobacteriales bacterium]|nr:hypothetical protein [Flavobacteriales bacterium]MDG1396226.1 hypothetical protein [Flavobacteriales bacterium]